MGDVEGSDDRGGVILEGRFDAFLPEVIQSVLQAEEIRQQAYSRYGACRRFG